MTRDELATMRCEPRKGDDQGLDAARAHHMLSALPEWKTCEEGKSIAKSSG